MVTPERFFWAAELMEIKPDHNILEIGCGVGLLAELIAMKLKRGNFIGIDRSPQTIDKAEKRNAGHIARGTSSFVASDFGKTRLQHSSFDRIVAFNVNLFIKGPSKDLELIRGYLKKGGKLFVFYQAPYEIDATAAAPIKKKLAECHFHVVDFVFKKLHPTSAFCITAQPV